MTVAALPKKHNSSTNTKLKVIYPILSHTDNSILCQNTEMPDIPSDNSIFNPLVRGRVAIFVDELGLSQAAKQLEIEIDYSKLIQCLTASATLLRAFFYSADKQHQSSLFWMRRHDHRIALKNLIHVPNRSKKNNPHVEIAVDMKILANRYDTAVIVSSNEQLTYAIKAVSCRGVRVEIVGLRSMTSNKLINAADWYIDLETIKQYIQMDSAASKID